jgi:LemA protein
MKKKGIYILIILIFGYLIYNFGKGFNNEAVVLQEDAKTTWSNVESAYQRRNDLIGNLVKTVQGAADFEKETLIKVIEARSKATSTTINAGDLSPEKMAQFQKAQAGLSGALSKLLLVVERYPDLKANANFLELQSQLEGTENRINIARDRFNEGVNNYNKHIKVFPNSVLAGMFNFDEMSRFKSNPGSENAPEVNFDFKTKK